MKLFSNVVLFLVFFVNSSMYASSYRWSVSSSKTQVYVNEAIYLKYECLFDDRAELYSIKFNPTMDTDLYTITLLSEETSIDNGKKKHSYEFVAFVKKAMMADFSFDALMEKTNQDAINNTVLGRDNADYEEFLSTRVKQKSIKVDVLDIPSALLGRFSLQTKKDKTHLEAYKPYHLDIRISGLGNFDAIDMLEYKIQGVKVFSQTPRKELVLTKEGYKGVWNQKFAFVSDKDFKIPQKTIRYFDRESKSMKELQIEEINVKVEQVYKKSELLDEISEEYTFSYPKEYIYYGLTFLVGFLLANINFQPKRRNTKSTQLKDKIKNSKSLTQLSIVMILNNQRVFNDILIAIDSKKLTSLKKAKKEATKLIMDT